MVAKKKTTTEAVVAEEPLAVAATEAPAKVKRVRVKKAPAEESPLGPVARLRKLSCQTIHRYAAEQFAIQQGWLRV